MFDIFEYLIPVVASAILHSLGTSLIVIQRPRMFGRPSHHRPIRGNFIIAIVLVELLVLHVIEIGLWGLWLWALGVGTTVKAALYFAGVCYTTLGFYTAPPEGGAVAAIILGMMGLLIFGWSAGILITTVMRYEELALGWKSTGP